MMRRSLARYCGLVIGVAGLAAAGLPAAHASGAAGVGASAARTVGDSCLVGSWHDNGGRTTTRFEGHRVVMRARGGDVDHISASGHDRDSWAGSKLAVGSFRGHRLTEQIHGTNSLRVHAKGAKLTYTELGWSAKSKNRYVYRGQHTTGYFHTAGDFTTAYRCTATTLRFYGSKGKVVGTETRLSSTP